MARLRWSLIGLPLGVVIFAAMAYAGTGNGRRPRAEFTVSDLSPQTGETVTFDASGTRCFADGYWSADHCAAYRWDDDADPKAPLDDPYPLAPGGAGVCQDAKCSKMTIAFQAAGTKYVWLTVTDNAGRQAQTMTPVVVGASPTPTPTPTPSPGNSFPSPANTGTPPGWTPSITWKGDLTVRSAGAVLDGYRVIGTIYVEANNVTIQNTEVEGGQIRSPDTSTGNLLVRNTTIDRNAPETNGGEGVISYCGYTADHVKVWDRSEGLRTGCSAPVTIKNSFINIEPPSTCGDWHGDGFQGYTGGPASITNTTIDFNENYGTSSFCGGTAPVFYPRNQGNTRLDVNHVLVSGGGFSFRDGMPGTVQDLQIECNDGPATDDTCWHFGAIDVYCPVITSWSATIVTVDEKAWTTTKQSDQPCNSTGGL